MFAIWISCCRSYPLNRRCLLVQMRPDVLVEGATHASSPAYAPFGEFGFVLVGFAAQPVPRTPINEAAGDDWRPWFRIGKSIRGECFHFWNSYILNSVGWYYRSRFFFYFKVLFTWLVSGREREMWFIRRKQGRKGTLKETGYDEKFSTLLQKKKKKRFGTSGTSARSQTFGRRKAHGTTPLEKLTVV